METKINVQKLIIATIVAAVISFAVGVIWHVLIFKDYYSNTAEMKVINREEVKVGLIGFADLIHGFVLAWFYMMAYRNGSAFLESLVFGIMAGLLSFAMAGIVTYSIQKMPESYITMEGTFSLVQCILISFGIMAVTGKRITPIASA